MPMEANACTSRSRHLKRRACRARRIRLDERAIEVAEVLDPWFGSDYRYCKIRGDDGALYILRLDEKRFAWSLTLFTSPKAQALLPQTGPASARRE
jgi:hypothetical protein